VKGRIEIKRDDKGCSRSIDKKDELQRESIEEIPNPIAGVLGFQGRRGRFSHSAHTRTRTGNKNAAWSYTESLRRQPGREKRRGRKRNLGRWNCSEKDLVIMSKTQRESKRIADVGENNNGVLKREDQDEASKNFREKRIRYP